MSGSWRRRSSQPSHDPPRPSQSAPSPSASAAGRSPPQHLRAVPACRRSPWLRRRRAHRWSAPVAGWVPDNRWDLVAADVDERTRAQMAPSPSSSRTSSSRSRCAGCTPHCRWPASTRHATRWSWSTTAHAVRHLPRRAGLAVPVRILRQADRGCRPGAARNLGAGRDERRRPGVPRRRHAAVSGDDRPARRLAERAARRPRRRPSPPRRPRRLVAGGDASTGSASGVRPHQRRRRPGLARRTGTPARTTCSTPTIAPTGS